MKSNIDIVQLETLNSNKSIIKGLLNEMVLNIENQLENNLKNDLIFNITHLSSQNVLFNLQRKNIKESLDTFNKSIQNLRIKSEKIEADYLLLYEEMLIRHSRDINSIWKLIMDYLDFKDLLTLKEVNLFFKNQVVKKLRSQEG